MPEQNPTAWVDIFGRHNLQRHTTLTPRVVDRARRALASPRSTLTEKDRAILALRVSHPDDTLSQLAARVDITRDAASSALRRALLRAEAVSA